ncbi:MAG TPA: sterol desaturase family protein [Kofleriaceae bacterium]|nr:sterol desaturase family protein [Kofleriaceae bacterium]
MEAIFTLLIPITFVLLLVLERLFPAREQPKIRFWLVRGIAFFVATAAISSLPAALVASALAPYAPLHLDGLPTAVAGLIGIVVTDLVSYVVHRVQHNWRWLWRWTHQMHHAAERVDVAGSAIFHPFELVMFAVITSFIAVMLGLSPAAAALAGLFGAVTGMFSHLNIRTPRWLGYIIQRPEAHSIHHARGVHAYNYGNLTVWDLALGTFRNPASFAGEAGFWNGASNKFLSMLVGRDVAEPTR